jgi:tRNA dimethylallyltransferase
MGSVADREDRRQGALLIAGPTASGKSALALDLARRIGGVVVNVDSMQVYRDLRILTARPSLADEAAVPHALYGTIDGAENFSVGRYLEAARPVLQAAWQAGQVPILTGGTGLYFKALTEGLSEIPHVPEPVRAQARTACEGVATADLHARLDPASRTLIRPTDRMRVMRALEVFTATGQPLSVFHSARTLALLADRPLTCLFLAPERTRLRQAIDARFESMVRDGALDEVALLAARHLDPMLPVMRAHGAPALMAYLAGKMTLPDAIARGQADTRAYVKRQFTWFRNQMPGWRWLDDSVDRAVLAGEIARMFDRVATDGA